MSGYKDHDAEKYEEFVRNSTANNDMMDRFGIPPSTKGDAAEMVMVCHPKHYGGKDTMYEVINVIEAWNLDFHCGNVIKYIARHTQKGSAKKDIKKAIWYLERYLKTLEGEA